LSLALKECQFGRFEKDCLTLRMAKDSLSSATMQDPQKRARLEAWLSQAMGRSVSVRIETKSGAGGNGSPARAAAPAQADMLVLRNDDPPEESDGAGAVDTYELYLRQDPVARAREAMKRDTAFREKVDLVRRFFDGRVLDPSGEEIRI